MTASLRELIREFLTGLGSPPADARRLHLAAQVRLVFLLPAFYGTCWGRP